jgi:hypothetical protein
MECQSKGNNFEVYCQDLSEYSRGDISDAERILILDDAVLTAMSRLSGHSSGHSANWGAQREGLKEAHIRMKAHEILANWQRRMTCDLLLVNMGCTRSSCTCDRSQRARNYRLAIKEAEGSSSLGIAFGLGPGRR